MARYNPKDYETVNDRLIRARGDNPELIVITRLLDGVTIGNQGSMQWVVHATLYKTREDYVDKVPWSTGLAFEVDGAGGMANEYSALENCETSAIGRALANAGYHGSKRPSREEMEKVRRGKELKRQKQVEKQQAAMLNAVSDADLETLHELWKKASDLGIVDEKLVEAFKARGEVLKK